MKSKFTKLLSLILALTLLVSAFAIFASAETEGGGDTEEDEEAVVPKLLIYRTYDEGWDFFNGTGDARKENNFFIDYETTVDYSYNYFFRIEGTNGQDGFSQMNFSSAGYPSTHKVFVEFDVKADDYCNIGNMIYSRTLGGTESGVTMNLLSIFDNQLRPLGQTGKQVPIGDEWIHVCTVFDYTDEELKQSNTFMVYQYLTLPDGTQIEASAEYVCSTNQLGLDLIRIGRPSGSTSIGSSYCLDNLVAYYNASEAVDWDVEKDGYGSLVNTSMSKTIAIKGGSSNAVTAVDAVKQGLAMKVGVNNALLKWTKTPIKTNEETGEIYGAPVVIDGNVLVPLEIILNYIGYPLYIHPDGESYDISTGTSASYITVGRDTATVDGERIELTVAPGYAGEGDNKYLVIAMDDVEKLFPGVYVTYDTMGLIVIASVDDVLVRDTQMTEMLDVMKEFIFEYFTEEQIYNDVKETTENFQHPYLVADQDRFDELRAIYLAEEGDENYDANGKKYIQNQINSAEKYYKQYAIPTATLEDGTQTWDEYVGFLKANAPVNPYPETNGYDPDGGRLNESGQNNNKMMQLAFAYQMTRDIKYALLAYDFGIAMAAWEHWGPGHFLNAADAAAPYAMATDWIYNAIVEYGKTNEAYNIDKLVDGAYKNGTWAGYYAATTGLATHASTPRGSAGNNANYYNTANNWNAVCASGMIMCALLTMENETYKDQSTYLAVHNFEKLCRNGLGQYAPDGSYVESPGYWSYGTNTLFRLCMTLEYAAGTDYDLFNCWGLEKTCYFACQSESSDYATFNYHDGGVQQQDCSYFFFVAHATGDSALATIRLGQLNGGKSCTIQDLLYYPIASYAIDSSEPVELPLDYYMEGIDAFVARSSWEKGAMYTGIIGGMNNASHGQVDSGDFVYHNEGKIWIYDLGADNYNVYGYWSGPTRYMYYKMNAEGNNTLAMVSKPNILPHGQDLSKGGKIIDYGMNEHGSYTIIDQTEVYGSDYVSYAYRGMFVTNDRKTVIIQDEVSMVGIESLYWFAHFRDSIVKSYSVAADGRSAVLRDGDGRAVRLSIVSKSLDFKFEVMDCYTFFLLGDTGTVNKDYSINHGGVQEHDRSGFHKLAIRGDNVLSFNVAVVIEMIDEEDPIDVGYEWTPMADWAPYADTRAEGNTTVILKRDVAKKNSVLSNIRKATDYIDKGTAYSDRYKEFYRTLTDIQYVINNFDDFDASYNDALDSYYDLLGEYTSFTESVNDRVAGNMTMVKSVLGMGAAEESAE